MRADSWEGTERLDISKQLFRNTIAGWFEMVILLVSGLIVPPLLLASLGKEGYGVWLLVGQVAAYLPILDLGVSSSVGRFVAKYNARKDYAGLSRIVSSSIFLFLASSICVLVATVVLWPGFSRFFRLSQEYFNVGRWLILLTGLGIAIDSPLRIGQGILQGLHRFDLMYLLRAAGAFLRLLFIIVLFGWAGCRSMLVLGVLAIVATLLTDVLMCGLAYHKSSNVVSLRYVFVNLSTLKEIWSLSLSTLLVTIAALLFNQGQIIGVGKLVGPQAVTLYALPVMLLTYGSMVIAYIVGAFKPMASHMQALNERQRLQGLNIAGVKISLTISLFIAVIAVAFGYPFLRMWLHASKDLSADDFVVLSNVLTIMVVGFAIGVPQNVTSNMLSGVERQWFVAFTSLAASMLGFCIGLALMTKTSLGLYGMAFGWVCVFLARDVLVLPVKACRHFEIGFGRYIKKAYVPPLGAAAILIIVVFLVRQVLDTTSFIRLLCSIVFCIVVYAVTAYLLCLSREEKASVWSVVGRLRARAC